MSLLALARSALQEHPREEAPDPVRKSVARVDPDVERRRAKALALLAEDPACHVAVVAEQGDPAHVAVAVGELEIPAERFDGFALLALMGRVGPCVGEIAEFRNLYARWRLKVGSTREHGRTVSPTGAQAWVAE